MTEDNTQASAGDGQDSAQQFAVQRIYLKDLSFETPMGPAVFQ
ncbi:MAG: protein-export chaperone SecB, partial [Porticoccus sp.]